MSRHKVYKGRLYVYVYVFVNLWNEFVLSTWYKRQQR